MSENQGIKRFEDLKCWQVARDLVNSIYKTVNKTPFSKNFRLKDQIQAAAVSVMANIAEGFGAFSNPEFVRFLKIASRSCLEVQSHLYVALDNELIDKKAFNDFYDKAASCANMIRAFIRYLREGQ